MSLGSHKAGVPHSWDFYVLRVSHGLIYFVTAAPSYCHYIRVLPLSRSQVGVRACRALPDGRLLSVNGLGVLEQFDFSWKEWHAPLTPPEPEAAAADAMDVGGGVFGGVVEEKGQTAEESYGRREEDYDEGKAKRCVFTEVFEDRNPF